MLRTSQDHFVFLELVLNVIFFDALMFHFFWLCFCYHVFIRLVWDSGNQSFVLDHFLQFHSFWCLIFALWLRCSQFQANYFILSPKMMDDDTFSRISSICECHNLFPGVRIVFSCKVDSGTKSDNVTENGSDLFSSRRLWITSPLRQLFSVSFSAISINFFGFLLKVSWLRTVFSYQLNRRLVVYEFAHSIA